MEVTSRLTINMSSYPHQSAGGLCVSQRVQSIPEALSIYVNQIVYDLKRRGQDVITLSLGEAFFDIPLFDFRKLDIEKCYHYSDSQGIPELREKISSYYRRFYRASIDPKREVMVTAGSKIAIFMVIQTVADPGDEILIHEPAWLSYQEQAKLVGALPKFIPYQHEIDRFEGFITPRTKLLILCNPNNPAGRVYTENDLLAIYRQCQKHGVFILVDEAYSDFVKDVCFSSMAQVIPSKNGIVVVNSLSKNMGMSGWRIGYVIAHGSFITQLLKVNQHLITCAPSILVHYMARYFDDITAITLPQVRQVVEKRHRVSQMLRQLGLSSLGGGATFYFFVSLGTFEGSSLEFALELLLKHGVAVVPGSAYGSSTEHFVRVSIGTESEERIWQALVIIRDLIQSKVVDIQSLRQKLDAMGVAPYAGGL